MLTRIFIINFLIIISWFSVNAQDATFPFEKSEKPAAKESFMVRWPGTTKDECKKKFDETIYKIWDSNDKQLNPDGILLNKLFKNIGDNFFHPDGDKYYLEIELNPKILGDEKTVKVTLQALGEANQEHLATLEFKSKTQDVAQKDNKPITKSFISKDMIESVSESNCNNQDSIYIEKRRNRQYNTDYLITYNPGKGVSGDVYTIHKHIIKNVGHNISQDTGSEEDYKLISQESSDNSQIVDDQNNKSQANVNRERNGTQFGYLEIYRRKNPKFFAPSVGSSITFEAINIPLNNNITKLQVNEQDLFNGGANQFSSIITGLVTAQIVNPLTPKTANQDITKEQNGVTNANDTKVSKKDQLIQDIIVLNNELQSYISSFRISSCAINAHQTNLRNIIGAINKNIEINAIGTEDLEQKLNTKIDSVITDNNEKLQAKKNATAISTALKSLDGLKPLVYSTIRAKNKDYIEIKYVDANGVASNPENIRMSGGMKIDFSAGFIITGLKDYSYVLKPMTVQYDPDDASSFGGTNGQLLARDTTGNVITKENTGKADVGVSVLTHFYPRLSSNYNLGGAVGLMTTTDLNLRLMLGGSFMVSSLFGSNHRISFTGGKVWGKVKRLSVKDEPYLDKPDFINGVPQFYSGTPSLTDMNDHSWFFSVTFNFGGN